LATEMSSVVDLHIFRYAEAVAHVIRQSRFGRVQVLVNKASTTVDSVTRATALPQTDTASKRSWLVMLSHQTSIRTLPVLHNSNSFGYVVH